MQVFSLFCLTIHISTWLNLVFDVQGTVVVVGRARAVVVGVGSNTAMGSIRDAMSRTNDVWIFQFFLFLVDDGQAEIKNVVIYQDGNPSIWRYGLT